MKVPGSNPGKGSPKKNTGMAQRERAGLITPRTQDRDLLPVSSN